MKKGYIVVDQCEEWEMILCLETGEQLPEDGILCWPGDGFHRHVFSSRKEARAAINRTHHYAKSFGYTNMPEKALCKIEVVALPD